ncbi:DegT/DnrJ/EryC1/StrS family aminotransferase [Desulfopila aestuarii]|uniref:dTDP-4-amino-4,6-dideoxygalactose transaminase n=1 Tax=Desulfopila aestuarii DSM 18488 TaxID=1121416 RepID=A0A1M7Y1D7_9BACT|nr:DegT/DnrJ/EryC1/StrS family aminotransferase [Desulfopila aestuarii]SHO45516.1 dTDP-4-amino-4,6-dideoxygalactose transaminase [Desulfopila aestuarii DSM 18488]
MKVPLLDLQAQFATLENELVESVTGVLRSTRYIHGPEVVGLEEEVATYSGANFGVGVSSGTDALLVALMALDIGPGDEVLTTPYSFFATMGVVLRLGAKPVFADIDPVSFNIDPEKMREVLAADTKKKIKAIIPVHLYGQCADMTAIMKIAEEYDLPVIEDAAQAIGTAYPMTIDGNVQWKKAGAMGLAGCFSFFPSKNLGGVGDGGMVTCQDESFAKKIELLRNHGAHPKYYHSMVGGNFRLDAIQAAPLRVKLRHLDNWHKGRRANAELYNRLFGESGLTASSKVVLPVAVYADRERESGAMSHIYNQYIIRVEQRDALRDWLLKNDIGCEIYYPVPLHRQDCLGTDPQPSMPHAEQAAAETIALPIYPELTDEMQMYVVETIARFYK